VPGDVERGLAHDAVGRHQFGRLEVRREFSGCGLHAGTGLQLDPAVARAEAARHFDGRLRFARPEGGRDHGGPVDRFVDDAALLEIAADAVLQGL